MYNTVLLFTLVSIVSSHDVIVGTNTEGRKIYDEVRHASPTIWRQTENLTVTTTDAEVISRIVITDLRPDKDGDVKIVEGGEGQKNVTLELKSPTVLRGYDFQIQVYSIPEDKFKSDNRAEVPVDAGQTRVQRNPEDDRNRPTFNPPRAAPIDAKKQESATTKSTTTSMSDDTKINDDRLKTIEKDSEDANDHKPINGQVPFVGNRPQGFNVPVVTTPRTDAGNLPHRHARETLNPEIPEENQSTLKKTSGNLDETRNKQTSTQDTFNRANPAGSTTTKPENKRDARDTEQDKKTDNDSTTNESSTQPPAFISRQGIFNRPSLPASTTNKPEGVVNGKRDARESEDDKKSDEGVPHEYSQHPSLTRQGTFNNTSPSIFTTNKPGNIHEEKRQARDTEHEKKSDNTTPKRNSESSTEHPALTLKQGTFKPTVPTTNKPENTNENRNARDTAHDQKSNNNTTPKGDVDNHPAHSRTVFDVAPQVDVKTDNTSTTEADQTTVNKHEENARTQLQFIPPPGYKRVVIAHPDEKERVARDVNTDAKTANPPRSFTNNQDVSKTNVASTTSTTVQPNDEDLRRPQPTVHIPRIQYQPLPYSTTTESATTDKSQNKRDTKSNASENQQKKDNDLKNIPRVFSEQNSTITEQKPVISIQ